MKLYGIASLISRDVDDWYATREAAEATLASVIADEPDLVAVLYVASFEMTASEN